MLESDPFWTRCREEDDRLVLAFTRVGAFTSVVDGRHLLEEAARLNFASVLVEEIDGDATIMVRGAVPFLEADAGVVAALIDETASLADMVEEQIFGTDYD